MEEERRARIRELLSSAMPGGVVRGVVPASLSVNVFVGSFSKK